MKPPRISIAMATYNGEKYLQEQLDSLTTQTYAPYELVIGDDGSTDGTIAIIEEFSRKAPFPVKLTRNEANLGFADNFLQTASRCSGDWIAFCDQDDVWLPNKIENCKDSIISVPNLNLILQNADICDLDLKRSGRVFPNSIRGGCHGPRSQFGFWVWPGFLQTVRADLLRRINFEERPLNYSPFDTIKSHDIWICFLANALGGIFVIEGVCALYRRHQSALTGMRERSTFREEIRSFNANGARRFEHLASAAQSSASIMEELSNEKYLERHSSKLHSCAEEFRRLELNLRKRYNIYISPSKLDKIKIFCDLAINGGYFGNIFSSMGYKGLIKDAYFSLLR